MLIRTRTVGIAIWLGVAAALLAPPASAADTGNGSKNFRAPSNVPNYFSNEAGPMVGGAAESQRGELYGAPTSVAAAPAPRTHLAVAAPQRVSRQGAVHGRSHSSSHAGNRHGGAHHPAAQVRTGRHVSHAAVRNGHARPAPKAAKIAVNHRRGRG